MPQDGNNGQPVAKKRGRPPKNKEVVQEGKQEIVPQPKAQPTPQQEATLKKARELDLTRPVCLCCGTQKTRGFYKSHYKFNKAYGVLPYCKDCLRGDIWNYYMIKFGHNQQLALHGLLRSLNLPYIHTIYEGAIAHLENPNTNLSQEEESEIGVLISAYLKNYNSFHNQNGYGNTYMDSEGLNEVSGLSSFEDSLQIKRKRKKEDLSKIDTDKYETIEYVVEDLIMKWGDLPDETLKYLESQYLDWKDKIGDFIEDKSTELMVIQLCFCTLDLHEARMRGEETKEKMNTFLKTIADAGLAEKQNLNNNARKSLGLTIKDLEDYAPIKPVDCALDDVDGYRDMGLAIMGCLFKAQGVTNEFTEAFDRIYKDYELDAVKNLVLQNSGAVMSENNNEKETETEGDANG